MIMNLSNRGIGVQTVSSIKVANTGAKLIYPSLPAALAYMTSNLELHTLLHVKYIQALGDVIH